LLSSQHCLEYMHHWVFVLHGKACLISWVQSKPILHNIAVKKICKRKLMLPLQKEIKCVAIELELLQVEMLAGKVLALAILTIVYLAICCWWVAIQSLSLLSSSSKMCQTCSNLHKKYGVNFDVNLVPPHRCRKIGWIVQRV